METEGIFSGVEFLQVKRCFLVLTKLQLDIYQSSQSKSCTQSTYYADSPAAHSEGGTVPPHGKPAWTSEDRGGGLMVRETNTTSACMLKGKCVHPYCSPSCVLLFGFTAVCQM